MTIYIDSVKRLRAIEEANGSFEVDQSNSLGSFKNIPAREGTIKLQLFQPTETPGHVEQHIDGYPLAILMPKRAELEFDINLETIDTKAITATQAAQGGLGLLFKVGLGGETRGTGTTIASTSTTTSLVCTSAAGIAVGTAVALATGTGGAMEIREVKSKSSNTLTLKLALSRTPASPESVLSCATYSLGGTDGSQTTSLQMCVEGLSPMDRWILRGGQMTSLSFENLDPGGIPRCKMKWTFTRWDYADGAAVSADLTATALGIATYTNVVPNVVFSSEFRSQTVGTSTLANTLLQAPKIAFKPNVKYTAHKSPTSASTCVQWLRDRAVPAMQVVFSLPEESKAWYTALTSRTSKAFMLQVGSSMSAGGFLLTAPTCQVTDVQQSAIDNIHSVDVTATARLDEDTSEGTATDLGRSTFRWHAV